MYIVMTASAKMPSKVKAPYLRVALVELEDGFVGRPAMISERARGIKRIVDVRERLHFGKGGEGTAAARAKAELTAEADRLNQVA